jgi:hypothetical protein
MRQRIDLAALYEEAVEQVRETDPDARIPARNPFTLDQLLTDNTDTLLAQARTTESDPAG